MKTLPLNPTADDLRNTKIRVNSPEESERFQKMVFAAGGCWPLSPRTIVQRHSESYLYVDAGLFMRKGGSPVHYDRNSKAEVALPRVPTATPHPHCEIIKQWADGAEVQVKGPSSPNWVVVSDPLWRHDAEYRIKPALSDAERNEIKHRITEIDEQVVALRTEKWKLERKLKDA